MTDLEDTFRAVLAARLPAGPAWTHWIDGTVAELAAAVPAQGIDRDALREIVADYGTDDDVPLGATLDAIIALLQPLEAP